MPAPAVVAPPQPPAIALSDSRAVTAQSHDWSSAVPPQWLELARKHPVLWMAVAPVTIASLLILLLLALEPERPPVAASPVAADSGVAAAPARAAQAPAAASPATPEPSVDSGKLAELESKAPSALSVQELLRMNELRAQRKNQDAGALARKLQAEPELFKDEAVQAELWRLVGDPDTVDASLAAMAQSRSSIGADLLYEVWTSRVPANGTAELARSLLYSRDVRPRASAALAAALELRAAESCEATQAALPQVLADGDRRTLPSLAKLNSRRGCGPKKNDDCYACLRAQMKQVVAAINAAKRRKSPSYPTR